MCIMFVYLLNHRYNDHDVAVFDAAPTRYHEKIRPGQATMLCASFSPGGTFFCVGSADHNVRVYQMNCPDGPQRILEEESHDDRVDSIQWCNRPDQLKFVSGSKDGTARIWTFKAKRWHTLVLNMKTGDNSRPTPHPSNADRVGNSGSTSSRNKNTTGNNNSGNNPGNAESEFRVTMVAWTIDDSRIVTAVSDKTLKVWDSQTGKLERSLRGHEEEIFVLEPHPTSWNLLLSSAHDGQIRVWDLERGEALFKHKNIVEENGQERGHAAVYDAKWSPDGLSVAASDSHGHLLFIGHGSTEPYDRLPVELFFHTDYRPLLRDSFHNVVDEQTQVPPHLLPPPFLVDAEGSPYPGYIQTFVPGREKMSESEALLPGEAAALGQARDQLQQQHHFQQGQGPQQQPEAHRLQQPVERPINHNDSARDDGAQQEPVAGPSHGRRDARSAHPPTSQEGTSNNGGGRTIAVHPQRRLLLDKDCSNKFVRQRFDARKIYATLETSVFEVEVQRVLTDHDYARMNSGSVAKPKKRTGGAGGQGGGRRVGAGQGNRPAAARRLNGVEEEEEEEDEDNDDNANEEEDGDDSSLDESDLSSMESTTEEETTDHSDWGSDDEAEKSSPIADKKSKGQQQQQQHKSAAAKAKRRNAAQRCRENMLRNPGDITEDFVPSPWLSESFPKKTPYFPQIGDVLMYFKQGHEKYLDLVKTRKSYEINMKEQQWRRKKNIGDFCLVKVTQMKFEIRPPRLCILKLSLLHEQGSGQGDQGSLLRSTGNSFTIKYHDMNDVVDFLILNDIYRNVNRGKNWKNGDRIRCQIDDCWWKGTVKKVERHDAAKRSPFLSIYVHWDNGEKEYLSPWDLEVLNEDTAEVPDGTAVTPEQHRQSLYQPREEEWNSMGLETESRRISEALETVMSLAIAEPFNYPVDLTAYPEYMLDIEYPMDLTLIKARIDNHFYRRIDAMLYDVGYIHTNAASFNRPRSDIVKNAKIITKLIKEIVQDPSKTKDDVSSIYHRLQSNFQWSDQDEDEKAEDEDQENEDTEEEEEEENEEENSPGSSRSKRSSKSLSKSPPTLNPKKWKHDCNELLNDMCSNQLSVPFRQPVSEVDYPDYHRCITTPMDLATVRESLHIGDYASPVDFQKDVLLIFKNSREYNTDKKAKIWSMTNKLEDWFEEHFRDVLHEWRKTIRRIAMAKKDKRDQRHGGGAVKGKGKGKGKGQSNQIKKTKQSLTFSEEDDDDQDYDAHTPAKKKKKNPKKADSSDEDSEDDDDDDDDFEEKMPTPSTSRSKALTNRSKREARRRRTSSSSVSTTRPNMFESQASAAGRRISSRIPKPPIRYRDNLGNDDNVEEEDDEEEEEERLPVSRRAQRAGRQSVSANLRDQLDDAVPPPPPAAAAAYHDDRSSALPGGRPRRQRRPARNENYTYSDDDDDDDEDDEEEDTRPLSRQRTPKKKESVVMQEATPKKTCSSMPGIETGTSRGASQDAFPGSSSSTSTKLSTVSTTDEDDIPLARKLSAKAKSNNGNLLKGKASTSNSGTMSAVNGSVRALRGTPQKRKEKSDDQDSEEVDSEEDSEDDMPLRKKKVSKGGSMRSPARSSTRKDKGRYGGKKKRKKSEEEEESDSEFHEEEEEEEDSEFDSDDLVEEDDEVDDDDFVVDDDDVPIAKSRRKQGRSRAKSKRPPRPQRRAAMQPKRNKSKRAAAAIDSESERTSARKPSRLTSRNAAAKRTTTSNLNPQAELRRESGRGGEGGGAGGREMRRAAHKRSYYEGDEEDGAEEEEEGDSARENRRPRRAAAATAAKRSRLAEDPEDEEDQDDYEDDGSEMSSRGRKRRPNPRII